jgi:hypothetical protein
LLAQIGDALGQFVFQDGGELHRRGSDMLGEYLFNRML